MRMWIQIVLSGIINGSGNIAKSTNLKLCTVNSNFINGTIPDGCAFGYAVCTIGSDWCTVVTYITGNEIYVIFPRDFTSITGIQFHYMHFNLPAAIN